MSVGKHRLALRSSQNYLPLGVMKAISIVTCWCHMPQTASFIKMRSRDVVSSMFASWFDCSSLSSIHFFFHLIPLNSLNENVIFVNWRRKKKFMMIRCDIFVTAIECSRKTVLKDEIKTKQKNVAGWSTINNSAVTASGDRHKNVNKRVDVPTKKQKNWLFVSKMYLFKITTSTRICKYWHNKFPFVRMCENRISNANNWN